MSTEAEYAYFLNSKASVVMLELLQISHPDMTQTYRVVRNMVAGVRVTLETGVSRFFQYYPLKISASKTTDDLDYSINVQLGDLGEVLPAEMDAIAAADGFGTKPTVIYRAYRSDTLTAPFIGPLTLEIVSCSFKREGSQFEAKAPKLCVSGTGELYDLDRFPMLRGFL